MPCFQNRYRMIQNETAPPKPESTGRGGVCLWSILNWDSKGYFRASMLIDPIEAAAVVNQIAKDLLMRMTVTVLIAGVNDVGGILLDQIWVKVV